MSYKCAKCDIELDSEGGLKRHMTTKHGGYYAQELRDAGVTVTQRDIARSLDGGNTSIESVIANAPESESPVKSSTDTSKRGTKEEREYEKDLQEFKRLRPQMIERWKRRLRIPYSMWARLANDPQIALSDKELEEGAVMHVDFCEAMGWIKAGKIEAAIDLTLWHGATALSRSEFGKQLLANFGTQEKPPMVQ